MAALRSMLPKHRVSNNVIHHTGLQGWGMGLTEIEFLRVCIHTNHTRPARVSQIDAMRMEDLVQNMLEYLGLHTVNTIILFNPGAGLTQDYVYTAGLSQREIR